MKFCIAPCLLALLLSGCSSISVTRDYDTSTDFSTLGTYAWQYEEQPQTGDARIDNDLHDERVRLAVNQTLAGKGFERVDRSAADFLVAYHLEYQRMLNSSSISFGLGRSSYGRYGGVGYNTGVYDYDQAKLIIDLLNPESEKMIWRGVGTRTAYDGASPEKMSKIVNQAVAKILDRFPPE